MASLTIHVRPFFPQLQRTFLKLVGDADASVRASASLCLKTMAPHHAKLELILSDLSMRVSMVPLSSSKESLLSPVSQGLASPQSAGGISSEVKEACLLTIASLLLPFMSSSAITLAEGTRNQLLACLGFASPTAHPSVKWLSEEPPSVQRAVAYLAGAMMHSLQKDDALMIYKHFVQGSMPADIAGATIQSALAFYHKEQNVFNMHPDVVPQFVDSMMAAPSDQVYSFSFSTAKWAFLLTRVKSSIGALD